jgi:oligopeptide transport system permease protein
MIPPAPIEPAPRALPLRLLAAGACLGGLVLIVLERRVGDLPRMLLFSLPDQEPVAAMLRSLLISALALGSAAAAALSLTRIAARAGGFALAALQWLALPLAAMPAFGLLWAWLGWWVGDHGGAVETLLPARPIVSGDTTVERLALLLWRWLLPVLSLSLPLTGLLASGLASARLRVQRADLRLGLRARGVPTGRMLARHLEPLSAPAWRARLLQAALLAPALLVWLEPAIDFPGWGTMASEIIQQPTPHRLALLLYSGGCLTAALTWLAGLCVGGNDTRIDVPASETAMTGHSGGPRRVAAAAALLVCGCLIWWLTGLCGAFWRASGARDALLADVQALPSVMARGALGAAILALPWLFLPATRRLLESLRSSLRWMPWLLWATALVGLPGRVLTVDAALSIVAALMLLALLPNLTPSRQARALIDADVVAGRRPFSAWRRHALPGLAARFLSRWLGLAPFLLAARVWLHAALPLIPDAPLESAGSFLALEADDFLHQELSLLAVTLAAGLSILSLHSIHRMLQPSDES